MLQPLGEKVLIRPNAQETVSAGGIVLPPAAQEAPTFGVVLAVGPRSLGVTRFMERTQEAPSEIEVGDEVLFSKYGHTEVEDGDEKLLIVKEADLIAVVTD